MDLLYEPVSVKCNEPNNEGISAFCLITTSHIALHSWEKSDPNLVQLDIYSCKNFSQSLILEEFRKFNPIRLVANILIEQLKILKVGKWVVRLGYENLF